MSSTLICVDISCQIVVVTSVFRELQNHKTLFRRKASLIVVMASQSLSVVSLLKLDLTQATLFPFQKREKSENNWIWQVPFLRLSPQMLVRAGYCRDVRGMEEKRQRAGQKEECFCLSQAAGLAWGRWRAAPSLPVHGLKDVKWWGHGGCLVQCGGSLAVELRQARLAENQER